MDKFDKGKRLDNEITGACVDRIETLKRTLTRNDCDGLQRRALPMYSSEHIQASVAGEIQVDKGKVWSVSIHRPPKVAVVANPLHHMPEAAENLDSRLCQALILLSKYGVQLSSPTSDEICSCRPGIAQLLLGCR